MVNSYTSSLISSSAVINASTSRRMSRRAYELSKIKEYFTKRNALAEVDAIVFDQEWKDLKISVNEKSFPFIKGKEKFWLDMNLFQAEESRFNKIFLILAIIFILLILVAMGFFCLKFVLFTLLIV